ncbi:MAG: 50S ribosome-binding GTPase [Planctomyces sp.]|nr:50S ribosome-binding GTPase [Planctomyces sp.]
MDHGIHFRILTPRGRGAVAVIELTAPVMSILISQLERFFVSSSSAGLTDAPGGRIVYGRWGAEDVVIVKCDQRHSLKLVDVAMVPHHSTADLPAVAEIHCHGGVAAVDSIIRDLRSLPATPWQEGLSKRSVTEQLNEALIRTLTRQTATWILRQSDGRLDRALNRILLLCRSPEEPGNISSAIRHVEELLRWRSLAIHLTEPFRVLVAGPPNVGKSSLVNRLVGYDRSIVYDMPGTTRDLVEALTVLDGWPVLFVDSAGLRQHSKDTVEELGINSVRSAASACDCCLVVLDSTTPSSDATMTPVDVEDDSGVALAAVLNELPVQLPIAVLRNKSDLNPTASRTIAEPTTVLVDKPVPVFLTSAKTGEGIAQLSSWLITSLIPETPDQQQALPVGRPMIASLEQLAELLRQSALDVGVYPLLKTFSF